jgi:SAM-dependent methyltransferase
LSLRPRSRSAAGPDSAKPSRSRLRRLLPVALVVAVLALLSRPGRKAVRSSARWVDSRVEGFSEPESRFYSHFFAPVLGRLYRGVASDVAAELAARGRARRAVIVDLGCGPGDLALELAHRLRDARIVGVDVSPSMMQLASRHATIDGRLRFVVGDAEALPFADESVDLVVSTLSLHHWTRPGAVFDEISRVLRPGGLALVYDVGLLTMSDGDLAKLAGTAGLGPDELVKERVGGILGGVFLVRFRLEGPAA